VILLVIFQVGTIASVAALSLTAINIRVSGKVENIMVKALLLLLVAISTLVHSERVGATAVEL
jgi:hypothetical protein